MGAAQLGKYQLVAEIARGGMGIVYLAVARGPARFHKLLVIKQLKPDLAEDAVFLQMFLEEARLAARLNHPNIVQTYEIGSDDERHYMVMDYLEGIPLARMLKKKSPDFTLAMRIRVACEVLQGLQYAHKLADFDGRPLGIVHRDATPHNVFVTYDGQIKLVDFGIAKAVDSTVETATGVMKGKPAYMAPEQVNGDVDARADLFSVGVMLWEAVAGRRMWERRTDVEIVAATLKGEVPSIREAAPMAAPALLHIIERALATPRENRYSSAAEFLTDLEGFLAQMGGHISARDVGKLASELFAQERANDKGRIESYLAGIDSSSELAKLPSLRPPRMDGSLVDFSFHDGPSATKMESSVTPGLGGRLTSSSVAPVQAPSKRNVVVAALSGVLILLALFVIVLALSAHRPPPAEAAQPQTAETRVVPEPPPTHEVLVRAFPESAVITIDGAEVSNPVKRTCVQGSGFSIHVSAPGTVSSDRKVICDRDESIEMALTAQPKPPAPPPPVATRVVVQYVNPPARGAVATKPAPPPPAAPPRADTPTPPRSNDVSPTGGTKPNRPIDTSSPYGQ
jgi:serine/threonine-protein kinase